MWEQETKPLFMQAVSDSFRRAVSSSHTSFFNNFYVQMDISGDEGPRLVPCSVRVQEGVLQCKIREDCKGDGWTD